ncbi:transcriptional protein SWT1 [Octopus bimaculoides]|uniref:WW domain-containing protein n=1 Tax=Octopus bimaculoides TaxID=37653 RepID=A0A0L8I383_OCTBM|nr:transcriptional protein SWT1 [Octopus bimaculoides]XP_014791189.1 transcriptional protein SWT1 [Octopus bimaculoides]XP_014791190.1 transcriptional protein SWT1 [Octopus bimaculoides]XP_052832260.1 transcriptional protein SWT1 [Octopus bimaculoides]|eukprot:XP_014791188.1 PREDICTED: transcriptional protein SWT1-like [Octopus bimaculoides]
MSSKSELPPGWLSRESKTHPGNFFYYNKETGLTTWKKPCDEKVVVEDDVSQKKDKESKKDAKTSKKRNKERQASMVPRAIRTKNHQIKNSGSTVSATPKKILPNVTVLNQKNCSLVADYGSDSDNGENKEQKKKTKVPPVKEKEENKRKRLNSSEKNIKESGILPVNTAREKVQVKWIQSFQEKKLLHLPLEAKQEKPQKKKKKRSVKSKSEGLTEPVKLLEDSPNQKKIGKKKTFKIKSKTLKKSHKLPETGDSNTTTSQIDSDSTKKKKIVKKKRKTVSVPVNKNNSCVLDGIEDHSSLVDSQLQATNSYPGDVSESLKKPLLISHDVFGFKDLTQPMEVDTCQEDEAMVVDIEEVRKILICQPSNEVMGDLTGSISEDYAAVTNSSPKQMAYIILDTNILLLKSGLAVIEKIRDGFYSDIERSPFIVVPWVVMQELDALKSKTQMNSSTAKHAQRAISFLFSCFNNKHPRIIGQSSREAMEQDPIFIVENNDDKILQCCMQFQKKYPHCSVVLFSNDKNLCNKSMINNITAYTQQSIEYGLKELLGKSEITFDFNHSENLSVNDGPHSEKLSDATTENGNRENIIATQIFIKIKDILEKLLTKILETEMKLAFDDIWMDIVIRKPPWDLIDILFCIKKHWIAVFGMIYDGNSKDIEATFISLYEYFFSDKDPIKEMEQVLSLIRNSHFVLKPLATKSSDYQEDINQYLKILNLLETICTEIISKTVDVNTIKSIDELLVKYAEAKVDHGSVSKSGSVMFNETLALNKFQKVWELLNHYCQEVEQALQRDPSAETCQQILTTLQNSIPAMETTYINFSCCLAMNIEKPCDTEAFNSLSNQLNLLLSELEGHDNEPKVTSAHLQALFFLPDKREMLNNGLGQLENMIRGLRTYHSKLIAT